MDTSNFENGHFPELPPLPDVPGFRVPPLEFSLWAFHAWELQASECQVLVLGVLSVFLALGLAFGLGNWPPGKQKHTMNSVPVQ